ncbi:MAG: hypothetical protein WA110_09040 [Anaerolineaceae bacterium]
MPALSGRVSSATTPGSWTAFISPPKQAYQYLTYGKRLDFRWLEERLVPLNFRLIFCTHPSESFEAARAKRLKVSGNPRQYDDLEIFKREQDFLEELVQQSHLPSLRLDLSDNNIPSAVERVVDWMEQTGGLSMPD